MLAQAVTDHSDRRGLRTMMGWACLWTLSDTKLGSKSAHVVAVETRLGEA